MPRTAKRFLSTRYLAVGSGSDITVGTPVVDGAVVVGKVIKSGKSKRLLYLK
jgi:ribosomal protein L21